MVKNTPANHRSSSYLGRFVNNFTGIRQYKNMLADIRKVVKGGRFIKMYRNGTRNYPSSTTKNDGTHFDAYLLPRSTGDNKSYPMFFNFSLINTTN